MTLREGIELILMKPIYSDKAIDEILKLFEKLIDEKIQFIEKIAIQEREEVIITVMLETLKNLKEELRK